MIFIIIAEKGFEPLTSGLWAPQATRLLYSALVIQADNGIQTHDINLGKVALYRWATSALSLMPDSNRRPLHYKYNALPTELRRLNDICIISNFYFLHIYFYSLSKMKNYLNFTTACQTNAKRKNKIGSTGKIMI